MELLNLKKISPTQKIYACIISIAVLLAFTFVHMQLLDSRLKGSIAKHDLAVKLLQQAQEIPFNSELIIREIPKSKDQLERNLNLYEKHFYTIKTGGLLYYDGVVSALTAASADSKEVFHELETIWFEFKVNGEVLLNQETFIGGSEMATGIIDEFGNYVAEEVFKSVTPEVRTAINFIEGNTEHFIELNKEVLLIYENEVKVFLEAKEVASYIDTTLLLMLIVVLVLLLRSTYFSNVKRLREFAEDVSSGNIDVQATGKVGGELGRIWEAFEKIVVTFKSSVNFIERIGKGELSVDYELKSDEDDFGKSLVQMKETMISAAEDEKNRKVEDDIRTWTTQGIAKFGELLRQNNSDINELSYSVVSQLIEYVGANQGGVFVLEEDFEGRYFSLVASYAYNRRKYIEKRIEWGDTLIGRCAQELKTLYLKEVPEEYLEISSGLGNYKPASLLLCPLKYNDEIYGVIELASFDEMPEHQIGFVEKVSESIASTISSVRVNSRTSKLLEESKEQAERLSQQEEEMRQNMEEMQATQEEAAIRTNQLEGIINAIDNTLGTFELDLEGKYVNANGNYIQSLKTDVETLLIQNHKDVVAQFSENLEGYEDLYKDLLEGKTVKRTFQYQLEDETLYFLESFTPVFDSYDEITKIIVFATNITESKQNEIAVQSSLDRVQEQELMLNENIEKIQEAQQLLEEKDERQRDEIAQLVADNEAKVMMLKMRESLSNAVINGSQDGVVVFNKKGEINIVNNVLKVLINEACTQWSNIVDFIGSEEVALEDLLSQYFKPGKDLYYKVDGDEIPLHVTIVETKTDNQIVYVAFVKDLRNQNQSLQQKDQLLSECMAREVKLKAKIEELQQGISVGNSASDSTKRCSDKLVEWDDSFSVGYASIDEQHKRLIDIINELYSALQNGQAFIKLQKILNSLIEYTQTHFSFEESLFSENNFEHSESHKQAHEGLLQKVLEFETNFKNGDVSVVMSLVDFLKFWLLDHILKVDMQYVGLLGDGKVKEEINEGVQAGSELMKTICWTDDLATKESGIDSTLKDALDFYGIVLNKYQSGIGRKETLALFVEFEELFGMFTQQVESRVVEHNFEYREAIVSEHQIVIGLLDKIKVTLDSGEESCTELIDEMTDEMLNYLSLGYKEFGKFISSISTQQDDIISEPTKDKGEFPILSKVEWNDNLLIGIESIDDQHKILVDLLSQLHIAFTENRTRKQIRTLLKGAVDYTEYHFGVEERHFSDINYSKATSHIVDHKQIMTEIKQIQTDYNAKAKNEVTAETIAQFASRMFIHFKEDDKAYVEEFKSNGIL